VTSGLFELGLSHPVWWSPVILTFLQMTYYHFSLRLNNIPCVYIHTYRQTSYFLHPFFGC
jgi:hypothetical protein